MTYFTLLLKGAITVWLEIQAFWSLMGYYEKEPQKAGEWDTFTSKEGQLYIKGFALIALCVATCLQRVPLVMSHF